MNPVSILLIGLAMSTDAFAAAIGKGAAMRQPSLPAALRVGLIFGAIETITPLIGWLLGRAAAQVIDGWDHWIALLLLSVLGLHMIYEGVKNGADPEIETPVGHSFWNLALTGFATSIDALAIGLGLAFLDVNILVVAVVIGFCTFGMVTLGIMLGHIVGSLVGRGAEIVGGLVLILVGLAIVYEHTNGFSFQ